MKKVIPILTIGAFIMLGCQSTATNEAPDEQNASELNGQEQELQTMSRDELDGYWSNNDYTFYIGDTIFYIYNHQNNYFHSYNFVNEKIDKNTLSISLQQSREEESISLLNENNNLMIRYENDGLNLSDDNLVNSKFLPLLEEEVDERFISFVETDGEVGKFAYQGSDLEIDDFAGYWVPMDKFHINDDKITPLGDYSFWLNDEFMSLGYYASSFTVTYIHDYEIHGNTLTTFEENLDEDTIRDIEMGYFDEIERNITETKYVLFQEEDDRDRLVMLASGMVLQRASEQEMIESFGSANEEKYISIGISNLETMNSLKEDQFQWTKSINVEDTVRVENYPYSIGDLSESVLYREKQVIDGQIPHPETEIDEDKAIASLLSGSYESTPSYQNLDYIDEGYYFSPSEDKAILTYGYGGRTHWSSGPLTLDVESISFKDNIFTVSYYNYQADSSETEQYYRINDEVIYAKDLSGQYTKRYAKDTHWEDFHNLPNK